MSHNNQAHAKPIAFRVALKTTTPYQPGDARQKAGGDYGVLFLGRIIMDVRWIKITTSVFDDEKIRLIEQLPDADMLIVIWFKLLVLAGKCNQCGMVYLSHDIPYTDEMLSTIMRRPINTIRLALNEFKNLRMIEINDNYISIVNWEKHQNTEGLDKIREQNRIRQHNYRQKQIDSKSNVTSRYSNATDKNRIDKNRIDENNKDKANAVRFAHPSIDEVKLWNAEHNNNTLSTMEIEYAYDHYQANGWKVGKNSMKDWKAAFRRVKHWNIKHGQQSKESRSDGPRVITKTGLEYIQEVTKR
jgi:predicted phage replisome organizer